MTVTEFRARVVAEILAQARDLAIENGSSLNRAADEYRAYAGVVVGMQRAAGVIEEFLEPEDADGRT